MTKQIIWQAKVLQIRIQLEGMKAKNKERESNGHSLAYGEEEFYDLNQELESLINEMLQYG